jgi:ankyrin repeat protein
LHLESPVSIALSHRSGNGFTEAVRRLLHFNNGSDSHEHRGNVVDINKRSQGRFQSSAYLAAQNGHADVLRLLLEHGAEIDAEDSHGFTPLYVACVTGTSRMQSSSCCGFNRLMNSTPTIVCMLHFAGQLQCAEILLDYGATVTKDMLLVSAGTGHQRVVDLLLRAGRSSVLGTDVGASGGCIQERQEHRQVGATAWSKLSLSDAEALYRRQQRHLAEGRVWSAGLLIYMLGFLVMAIGGLPFNKPRDKTGGSQLLYAVLQTGGLLTMCVADLDVDVFLRDHHQRVVVFILCYLIVSGLWIYFLTPASLLMALPFIYCTLRFDQVIGMASGFPRFTSLFALAAVGFIIGQVIYWAQLYVQHSEEKVVAWPFAIVSAVHALGAIAMATVYIQSGRGGGSSKTVQLNQALFYYLFTIGVGDFTGRVLTHLYTGTPVSIPNFLFGPVHVLPAGLILLHRNAINRLLGSRWLKRRLRDEGSEFTRAEQERGGLEEVERAIAAGAELDSYIRAESVADGYTLLMYSAGNGFEDAVVKLLDDDDGELRSADPNKLSRSLQRTAAHFAAQNGHHGALRCLIEHGAGINIGDINGFHPIYFAALKGHADCVKLLLDNGAYGADLDQQVALVAEGKKHKEVVQLLIEEGANRGTPWMGLSLELNELTAFRASAQWRNSRQSVGHSQLKSSDLRSSSIEPAAGRPSAHEPAVLFVTGGTEVLRASLAYSQ